MNLADPLSMFVSLLRKHELVRQLLRDYYPDENLQGHVKVLMMRGRCLVLKNY